MVTDYDIRPIALQVLRRARERIDTPEKWTQNDYFLDGNGMSVYWEHIEDDDEIFYVPSGGDEEDDALSIYERKRRRLGGREWEPAKCCATGSYQKEVYALNVGSVVEDRILDLIERALIAGMSVISDEMAGESVEGFNDSPERKHSEIMMMYDNGVVILEENIRSAEWDGNLPVLRSIVIS